MRNETMRMKWQQCDEREMASMDDQGLVVALPGRAAVANCKQQNMNSEVEEGVEMRLH